MTGPTEPQTSPDRSPVQIGLLGPVEIRVHRRPRPLGGQAPQAILVALALHAGRTVHIDRLVELAWDDPPPSATTSIAAIISRLRKLLAPATISRRGPAYLLHLDPEAVDVARFDRLADQSLTAMRDGDPVTALPLVEQALGMWRGQPLEGMAARKATIELRRRLRARRLDLLVVRGQALLDVGRVLDAVDHLHAVIDRHPRREHAWAVLARALYRADRQQEALDVLRRARAVQRDATGLDPSPALVELEQAILHHSPALSAARPAVAGTTAAATTFYGRMAEVDAVDRAISRRQHVLITGPPGVGKTRLAAEALARTRDGRPVRWIDVRAHADSPEQLVSTVLSALDVPAVVDVPPPEALQAWLAGRSLILVLDAAEHRQPEVERLGAALAGSAEGVTMLVTSRHRIDLPRAALVDVQPLPISTEEGGPGPAVQLYRDRAAALTVTPGAPVPDLALATRLCQLLDGLPLGLEVAAGLLRTFDPASLVRYLEEDRGWLLRDLGGPEARLRAALEDSWTLLTTDAHHVLASCATFAGTFTMPMLDAVVGDEHTTATVAAALQGLVASSLVQVQANDLEGLRTYRVLDTVRALAAAQQAPADRDARSMAHARWVAAAAGRIEHAVHGDGQTHELGRMEQLLADADQVVNWALPRDPELAMDVIGGLSWSMFLRTRLTTLRRWVDEVVAKVDEDDLSAGAATGASLVRYAQRQIPEAVHYADLAMQRQGDPRLGAFQQFWLAWVRTFAGDPGSAAAMDAAASHAAEIGLRSTHSYAETAKAWLRLLAGDAAGALAQGRASRALAEQTGQEWAVSFNAYLQGLAAEQTGELDIAAAQQREALELSMTCGHMTGLVEHLACLAAVGARRGQVEEAAVVLGALEVFVPTTGISGDLLVAFNALRDLLGEQADEAARAPGRRLPLPDVIELASRMAGGTS